MTNTFFFIDAGIAVETTCSAADIDHLLMQVGHFSFREVSHVTPTSEALSESAVMIQGLISALDPCAMVYPAQA